MVWSRDGDAERPPLSVILPRLYLGAESDVTQDQLTSLGISYVLSVSRCSPRPSFLPCSRYLRIPIDDSLWADLLPWIPQALHFIDAAMSSGASVLVHCAAGISRSPALAVAYVMYSLGMDLDQAYRFVKERRPSISPNFNFLGQLQHFQSTLSTRPPGGDLLIQQLDDGHTPSNQDTSRQNDGVKLWTLNHIQQEVQTLFDVSAPSSSEPVKPAPKPTQLQLPAASASLAEKRKSLSLSLTPLGICPPSQTSSIQQGCGTAVSGTVHKVEALRNTDSCRHQEGAHEVSRAPHHKQEQSLLSPLSYTLNKLLCWGERVLLGGLFVHNVRMGQAALPYRC